MSEHRNIEPHDVDENYMRVALQLAGDAEAAGEVPVGAIVVRNGSIVGRGENRRERLSDPTAHAEILALRDAAEGTGSWRLNGCTLYVTLEPCYMCAGALINARLTRLVFATSDPKGGACGSLANLCTDERLNHNLTVSHGVHAAEASAQLKSFFKARRAKK